MSVTKLNRLAETHHSLLCLNMDFLPKYGTTILQQGQAVLGLAYPHIVAVKFNLAYYISSDIAALGTLILNAHAKRLYTILDGKFGDVGHTTERYADWARSLEVDAVTCNPYMGEEAIEPFEEAGVYPFVVAVPTTSTAPIPNTRLRGMLTEPTIWKEQVALRCDDKGRGIVIGANSPANISWYRRRNSEGWILCPGVGAQGGIASEVVKAGRRLDGSGVLVSVGRSILTTYDVAAAAAAMNKEVNKCRR